jgi:hypothetical protein
LLHAHTTTTRLHTMCQPIFANNRRCTIESPIAGGPTKQKFFVHPRITVKGRLKRESTRITSARAAQQNQVNQTRFELVGCTCATRSKTPENEPFRSFSCSPAHPYGRLKRYSKAEPVGHLRQTYRVAPSNPPIVVCTERTPTQ